MSERVDRDSLDYAHAELIAGELRKTSRRLELLLEQLPDVVLYESGEGRDYVSSNIEKLLGYPAHEFILDITLFTRLIHPSDIVELERKMQQWRDAGRPDIFLATYRSRTISGEYRWIENHIVSVNHDDGTQSIIGVLIDITERRVEQERYEAIADAANIAGIGLAVYVDRNGVPTTIYANEASTKIANWAVSEVEGHSVFDFLPAESWPEIQAVWNTFLKGELIHHSFETAILHRDGHKVPLSIGLSVTNMGGEPAVIAFVTDISQQKRTEAALITARIEAEEMSRVKSNILANFSHELRTPMHSILGFSSLLEEELDNPELLQYVRSIEKSGKRLLATMTSILEVASLETNPGEMILHPAPISEAIHEQVEAARPLIEAKELDFRIELSGPELLVLIDKVRFGKALEKILHNALKFTRTGSITIYVRSEVRDTPHGRPQERVLIAIQDTGIGMSREFVDTAFEKFKQESTGFNRSYEGSGLGLSLARGYLQLMNGEIMLESEPGMGTTVTISLPLLGRLPETNVSRQPSEEGAS